MGWFETKFDTSQMSSGSVSVNIRRNPSSNAGVVIQANFMLAYTLKITGESGGYYAVDFSGYSKDNTSTVQNVSGYLQKKFALIPDAPTLYLTPSSGMTATFTWTGINQGDNAIEYTLTRNEDDTNHGSTYNSSLQIEGLPSGTYYIELIFHNITISGSKRSNTISWTYLSPPSLTTPSITKIDPIKGKQFTLYYTASEDTTNDWSGTIYYEISLGSEVTLPHIIDRPWVCNPSYLSDYYDNNTTISIKIRAYKTYNTSSTAYSAWSSPVSFTYLTFRPIKYYNGSSWKAAKIKTWNGSEWLEYNTKYYDSTSWQEGGKD